MMPISKFMLTAVGREGINVTIRTLDALILYYRIQGERMFSGRVDELRNLRDLEFRNILKGMDEEGEETDAGWCWFETSPRYQN